MKVLFATPPIPGASWTRPDRSLARGRLSFVARVFQPGEVIPPGNHPFPMADWRRTSLAPDGSLRMPSPDETTRVAGGGANRVSGVVVPKALLDTIRDDELLAVEWALVR